VEIATHTFGPLPSIISIDSLSIIVITLTVGTARALGGYNKKSPTENRAAANAREVITRVRL